jgi:hypothetical protein
MSPTLRAVLSVLTCLALGVLAAGCSKGPQLLKVKGKVVNNNKPLDLGPQAGVTLVFIPVVEEEKPVVATYPTHLNPDGTFELTGKQGEGIPPGKYQIAVQIMTPKPTAEVKEWNKTFEQGNSPLFREITSEEPLVIDLAKPTG